MDEREVRAKKMALFDEWKASIDLLDKALEDHSKGLIKLTKLSREVMNNMPDSPEKDVMLSRLEKELKTQLERSKFLAGELKTRRDRYREALIIEKQAIGMEAQSLINSRREKLDSALDSLDVPMIFSSPVDERGMTRLKSKVETELKVTEIMQDRLDRRMPQESEGAQPEA